MAKENFDLMTDEQIIEFIRTGKAGETTKSSLRAAIKGVFGVKGNMTEVLKLARQALKDGKNLQCNFIDGESCDGQPTQSRLDFWVE